MGQGLLVVFALLAAGLFLAATEHLRVVVCGGVERVELERVLGMRARTGQPRVSEGEGGQIEAR